MLEAKKLISFIIKNDSTYNGYNFENHSLTELVIIKTRIQLATVTKLK